MLGSFFLNIENVRMAIIAVKPPNMSAVGKKCRRDIRPLRFEKESLLKPHIFRRLDRDIMHRFNQTFLQCLAPVYLVSKLRIGQAGCKFTELLTPRRLAAGMTFPTVRLLMTKGCFPVMTTRRSAVKTCQIRPLSDFGRIHLHIKLKLKMAYPTREFYAMLPVRKDNRFLTVFFRSPVNEQIPMFSSRRVGGKIPKSLSLRYPRDRQE